MALFVKRDEQRSQLQERLATELQQKLKRQGIEAEETDPAILDDAHETRPAGIIITILLVLLIILAVAVVIILNQRT